MTGDHLVRPSDDRQTLADADRLRCRSNAVGFGLVIRLSVAASTLVIVGSSASVVSLYPAASGSARGTC